MANVINPKPSSRTYASISLSTAADGISEEINLTGLTLSCIKMSTAWTTANIGFQACIDGSTDYFHVTDTAGNFLTYAATASRVIAFDPAPFKGLQKIKLVSESSAGVAVAQAAVRTLVLGLSER